MSETSVLATTLLQTGLLAGLALAARILVGHRVAVDSIPRVCRHRVELWNRICPVLLVVALAVAAIGAGLLWWS